MLCESHSEFVFVFHILIFFLPLWHCHLPSYVSTPTFLEVCAGYKNSPCSNNGGLSRGSAAQGPRVQSGDNRTQPQETPDPQPPLHCREAAVSLVIHCYFSMYEEITAAHSENVSCSKPHILVWLSKCDPTLAPYQWKGITPVWSDSEVVLAQWAPGQEGTFWTSPACPQPLWVPVLSPSGWTLPCLTTVNTGKGGTAAVAQTSSQTRHSLNWCLMSESWEPLISQHCYGCWGYRSHRTRDVSSSMTASKEDNRYPHT